MRRYDLLEEERLRLQSRVRDWAGAGLLTRDQATAFDAELRTPLRRTGLMLRLGLTIFTVIAVFAGTTLVMVTLDPKDDRTLAFLAILAGIGAFALADWLVARFRFYRHGVEEPVAMSSVVFVAVGVIIGGGRFNVTFNHSIAVALVIATAVSALCYVRFGFQYAAIGGMVLAVLVPVPIDGLTPEIKRLVAAAICAGLFVAVRAAHARATSEILEDDARVVGAAAVAGVYVALNVVVGAWLIPSAWQIERTIDTRWFWWGTYASIWMIPAIGLWVAIRDRDRTLLRVCLVLALATLVTNKPYLGWPRQTWDPMLLGVLLMGGALAVRRWLASGPDGQRAGFTPARVLPSEDAALSIAGLASAAVHMQAQRPTSPAEETFGEGRSGGGGATGGY